MFSINSVVSHRVLSFDLDIVPLVDAIISPAQAKPLYEMAVEMFVNEIAAIVTTVIFSRTKV